MAEHYSLRLADGDVLLPDGRLAAVDVLVRDGRIAGIAEHDARLDASEVVSVSGLVVLPGVIDAHVHLGQDITVPKTADDALAETAAAAAGGVSTLLAYLMTARPYDAVFDDTVSLMEANSIVDFGFHFCIVTDEQLAALSHYARDFGVSSFKFFMNFRGDEGKYLGLPGNDDGFLYELMRHAAEVGGMVDPHGENIEIIWKLRSQASRGDMAPLARWHCFRPSFVEAEAQQRAAFLARVTGASMYAVHVTNQQTLDALEHQRRHYRSIFLETCPHYLTHDETSALGTLAKVNPPLRTPEDREALWRAIADGRINVVGSDHVPRHRSAKTDDIWTASAGFPGLQTLLPVLLSEGYKRRGIPLARLITAVSRAPAQLFGLYPRKGTISVGADADFAVVDLNATTTVRTETQKSGAGFTIYDGWEFGCAVEHTITRGEFAVRNQEVITTNRGRYQARSRSGAGLATDAA